MDADALVQAAFNGDLATLRQLLLSGANVDALGPNWTPLHAAIENENVECVKALVQHGARIDLDVNGLTPLAHAVDIAIDGTIQTGGVPGDEPTAIVEFLIAQGADPKPGLEVAEGYGSRKFICLLQAAIADA
jgi:ankyrin repeat protein